MALSRAPLSGPATVLTWNSACLVCEGFMCLCREVPGVLGDTVSRVVLAEELAR